MLGRIPKRTITRLTLYYRGLAESRRGDFVSSNEMSKLTGFSADQIRRDLSYFGQFGISGRGYSVVGLRKKLIKILGVDKQCNVAVVGAGNLGSAMLKYGGFEEHGFRIVCGFDANQGKTGRSIAGKRIFDFSRIKKVSRRLKIKIAILTVPAPVASVVARKIVESGIKGIMNFAPINLHLPTTVQVLNMDMGISLQRIAFLLKKGGYR